MHLVVRFVHALLVFGLIFSSYMIQLTLVKLFADTDEKGERVVPDWVRARRKEIDRLNAKRLLRGMLELRGVYIKLGQVLSIMGGFLPRVYARELEQLQDAVPPHSFREVDEALERSLGKKSRELFRDFSREPIAAASLGQVHLAHLRDGTKVAVKVLYPGIREVIAVDMRIVALAIKVYRYWVPVAKIERVHDSLVDLLRRETDYLHEAACMRRMAQNFQGDPAIAVPSVIDELTTRDVLTMTFMEGIKITRVEELRRVGIDTSEVAVRLVQSFYKQLFVDRFFHADPHPGNFLVEPTGDGKHRLVILDFGAICEAKDGLINGMVDLLKGFFAQDDAAVIAGFRKMGFVAEGANDELLERTVRSYFGKLLKLQDRTAAALMKAKPAELEKLATPEATRDELQDLMRSVEYPEDWFYVERACVLMFWLAAQIDPHLDTLQVGFPYVMPLLVKRQLEEQAEAEAGAKATRAERESDPRNKRQGTPPSRAVATGR